LKGLVQIALGTATVLLFADSLVDNISTLSTHIHISAFYIAFTLTPIASNASELYNTFYFAQKKTKKNASMM
jgi:Ca2+/Na+ antiporter